MFSAARLSIGITALTVGFIVLTLCNTSPLVLAILACLSIILSVLIYRRHKGNHSDESTDLRLQWVSLVGIYIPMMLILLATGGINSNFFLLIWFFVLYIALAYRILVTMLFLVSMFAVFSMQVLLRPDELSLLAENPVVVVTSIILFMFVIPLLSYLKSEYDLQEQFQNFFYKNREMSTSVEKKMAASLPEVVFVLSKKLEIISFNNEAVPYIKDHGKQALFKPFFDEVQVAVADDTVDLSLILRSLVATPKENQWDSVELFNVIDDVKENMRLSVRPVIATNGELDQLVLEFQPTSFAEVPTVDGMLTSLLVKHNQVHDHLGASDYSMKDEQQFSELMLRFLHDRYTFESCPMTLVNMGELLHQTVLSLRPFAQQHGISVNIEREAHQREAYSFVTPLGQIIEWNQRYDESYHGLTNEFLLKLLYEHVLKVAVLVSPSGGSHSIRVQTRANASIVQVDILCGVELDVIYTPKDLFTRDFGSIDSIGHLSQSTGVEGELAFRLAKSLGVQLDVRNENELVFSLTITRDPYRV